MDPEFDIAPNTGDEETPEELQFEHLLFNLKMASLLWPDGMEPLGAEFEAAIFSDLDSLYES